MTQADRKTYPDNAVNENKDRLDIPVCLPEDAAGGF